MRRLITTIMPLPNWASLRFSQCSTMSAATRSSRDSAPTMASRRAQRLLAAEASDLFDLFGDFVGEVVELIVDGVVELRP